MRNKAINLICSVGELTSLFERTSSIEGFLNQTVGLIGRHMATDLCSIYLVDQESGRLVLRASTGLSPAAVGSLSLDAGEGITGTALKELRPIILARAAESPAYKPIPNIDEEGYEAFLAVPVIHGLRRIGVIVCQQRTAGYYTPRDARALTAIAAQMAALIENALLLMELHRERKEETVRQRKLPPVLNGIKASPGMAIGVSYSLSRGSGQLLGLEPNRKYRDSIDEFRTALALTRSQIKELQEGLKENFADVGSLIFHAHLLMLTDEAFSGEMEQLIRQGSSAAEAVTEVVNRYIKLFVKADSSAVQEKAQDLKDLGHRLLHNLMRSDDATENYKDSIILTEELFPSELIKFAAQGAAGIVVHKASLTSHIKILGDSVRIPMVSIENTELFSLPDGVPLIVDGFQGNVFVEPDAETLKSFVQLAAEHAKLETGVQLQPKLILDNREEVEILANISLLGDLHIAKGYGARGVGLYRSEFPFLIRNDFPAEEEQYRIYRRIFEEIDDGPVYMRILDIGGDKQLDFTGTAPEENPFLGLRAIRFTLRNPEILMAQLRAMLRAGHGGDLKIIIPFVTSLEEIRAIRQALSRAIDELADQEIEHNAHPDVGVMIELPSTGYILPELAEEVDFMSIGTNDLIQYLLGVDRTNTGVAYLYNPFHPAVLRAIAAVATVCRSKKLPLSVCGDAILDPAMVRFALGIGVRRFSVSPSSIPQMHDWIGSAKSIADAEDFSRRLLQLSSSDDIQEFVSDL